LSIEDEEQFGDDNNWRMEFTRSGTIKLTESGDSIKIFAIIISMIEDFVINMKPNNIFFLSSTDNKDKSRVKLYDALINRFASKHGYLYSTRTSTQHSDLEYIFSRK
ncbi:MAG: hypothetical protein IIB83_08515, partial [Bacteroidetes bacterium]|nr:hypothetical protein [Bacteroidota bacterium]